MNKLPFFLIILLFGCHHSNENNNGIDEKFVNHNKWKAGEQYYMWKTGEENLSVPLKGYPKEIIESYFESLSDTNFTTSISGTPAGQNIYRFDAEGNMIYSEIGVNKAYIEETGKSNYRYDDNGEQAEGITYRNGDTSSWKRESTKKSPGVFESVFSGKHNKFRGRLTFSDNGNTMRLEMLDDAAVNKVNRYENERLVESESNLLLIRQRTVYHYSPEGWLEKIIIKSGGTEQVASFINNSHGDFIYAEFSEGDHRMERRWTRYEYDSTGNWTRRIEKIDGTFRPAGGPPYKVDPATFEMVFPEYILITRKITY